MTEIKEGNFVIVRSEEELTELYKKHSLATRRDRIQYIGHDRKYMGKIFRVELIRRDWRSELLVYCIHRNNDGHKTEAQLYAWKLKLVKR